MAKAATPPGYVYPVSTFEDLCREHRVTPAERVELAHRLAAMRYRATIEACFGIPPMGIVLRRATQEGRE